MRNVKLLTTTFIMLLCSALFAQQVSPDVIASAGDSYEGSEVSISWTLGEIAIETLDPQNGNPILTQGFHQPDYIITEIDNFLSQSFELNVYPNPAHDFISIKSKEINKDMYVSLIDVNGKILLNKVLRKDETEIRIPLTNMVVGTYFILIATAEGELLKSFQIQKTVE